MSQPMSALLARVANAAALSPKDFVALFDDFDFDGTASTEEMQSFWKSSCSCIGMSSKGDDRRFAIADMYKFASIRRSAFPKLNTNIIMFQMILRLLKPERVNQRDFGICGPAHFTVLLIKTKPMKYVAMAYDLLKNGKTTGEDGFEIVPDEYVKDFDPQRSIPEADWLLAASLRNAKTPIPMGKERGEYGGTKGPDVFAYCLHSGYSEIIYMMCYQRATDGLMHTIFSSGYEQFHPPSLQKQIEKNFAGGEKTSDPLTNLKIACWLRAVGWRVLLLTNGDLLTFEPASSGDKLKASQGDKFSQTRVGLKDEEWKSIATEKKLFGPVYAQNINHWVLAKKISMESGIVRLNVYTWGGQKAVKADVKVEEFANCYGGFVAARG